MMRAFRKTQQPTSVIDTVIGTASVRILVVFVACLLTLCSTERHARAQDFEAFEPPGLLPPAGAMSALAKAGQPEWQFGFQLFHLLLEQKGLYSVPDFHEPMDRRPRQTAVVLVGNMNLVPTELRSRLVDFLENGGHVLVASDESAFLNGLFLIQGGPYEVQADQLAFQGFRDCPVITALRPDSAVLNGVQRLVANRCGAIARMDGRSGNWTTLAHLPRVALEGRRPVSDMPLIAEWKSRKRRGGGLMLMADHSLLINGMLWHADNAKLAVNLSDWLSSGERREVVFIVDGKPIEAILALPPEVSAELPPLEDLPTPTLKELSQLPPDVLLNFANRFFAGMEDADVMNELLANQPAELETPRYSQALYVAAGILAAVYILRLMGRIGSRPSSPPPRAISQSTSETRLPTLSSGELHSAGKELAQSAMKQLTGSSDPQDWAIPIHDVEIEAGFFRRLLVREHLKRLKQLAANSLRTHTTPRDLKRLAKLITSVIGLQKEGRLRHPSILT
ncbi:MAG: DUF4350 domain-containing protein [Rhodopirellula sp.]|nr:DUF4350 domain-containing protein [Rhodopirellula sp.]